jgi:hypothetical protein
MMRETAGWESLQSNAPAAYKSAIERIYATPVEDGEPEE